MRARPTELRETSLITRMIGGLCLSFLCVILAFVIPLWPITFASVLHSILFMFLALGMPFAFLDYRADYIYSILKEEQNGLRLFKRRKSRKENKR